MTLPPQPQAPTPESETPLLSALSGDPVSRKLRGLLWPLGLLTAGLVAIILVLLAFAAHEQNELALETSRHLAETAIGNEIAEAESTVRDYATWNDTVRNVVIALDETWADENIGTWAYEGLHLDATLVVDGQGRPFYGMVDGTRIEPRHLARHTEGLGSLIAAARSAEPTTVGTSVSGFVRLDGDVAFAAAAPILWEDGRAAPDRGGAASVLIYLRRLDADALAELETGFLLSGLRLLQPGEAAATAQDPGAVRLPLRSHSGEVLADLAWTAEQPGFHMLRPLMLPGALAALVGALLLWTVIRRASKTMRDLEASHAVLREHAEALRAARDIAQQQTRNEVALRRRADAASRSKSEFLALVSHELRTPLNAILGFSETIAAQTFGPAATERYREYARDIHESGSHLLSIINDILDLTKVEAGRYELHEEALNLAALLRRCAALLRERASSKGLDLACSSDEIWLQADARALKQIVINLLSNAIKFTEAGGRVQLTAAIGDAGVEISIIDNGIGMGPDDLARALQPFGQAASALTRSEEGTGLGLNIVQALAELHGGRLIIDSQSGRGTTAVVRLPLERVVTPQAADKVVLRA